MKLFAFSGKFSRISLINMSASINFSTLGGMWNKVESWIMFENILSNLTEKFEFAGVSNTCTENIAKFAFGDLSVSHNRGFT